MTTVEQSSIGGRPGHARVREHSLRGAVPSSQRTRRERGATTALAITAIALAACGANDGTAAANLTVTSSLALGAPDHAVEQPANNAPSDAKIALGRRLFWDPILSGNRDVACASCHHPSLAYADGRRTSIGTLGTGLGPRRTIAAGAPVPTRNAMSVLDTAFNGLTLDGPVAALDAPMFWDDRAHSLEQQALGPITAAAEMRGGNFDEAHIGPEIVARLAAVPEYVAQFEGAFGPDGISMDNVTKAIATFERSIVTTDASFDRYMRGDASALTAQQVRGMNTFRDAGCTGCHSGPMFSDFEKHALGVPDLAGLPHDAGDGSNRFRTASLRFVTRTGPYMHNGVFATLDDVYRFYQNADDRSQDALLRRVRAPRGGAAADVTAFLASLSDGTFDATVPASVPSGLPVGGNLE